MEKAMPAGPLDATPRGQFVNLAGLDFQVDRSGEAPVLRADVIDAEGLGSPMGLGGVEDGLGGTGFTRPHRIPSPGAILKISVLKKWPNAFGRPRQDSQEADIQQTQQ